MNWDATISELEEFFRNNNIPDAPIRIDDVGTIVDTDLFIESHLQTVKHNINKIWFLPYLERLIALKNIITKKNTHEEN